MVGGSLSPGPAFRWKIDSLKIQTIISNEVRAAVPVFSKANNDALWDRFIIYSDWASFFRLIRLMASICYSSKHLEGYLICFHARYLSIRIKKKSPNYFYK